MENKKIDLSEFNTIVNNFGHLFKASRYLVNITNYIKDYVENGSFKVIKTDLKFLNRNIKSCNLELENLTKELLESDLVKCLQNTSLEDISTLEDEVVELTLLKDKLYKNFYLAQFDTTNSNEVFDTVEIANDKLSLEFKEKYTSTIENINKAFQDSNIVFGQIEKLF